MRSDLANRLPRPADRWFHRRRDSARRPPLRPSGDPGLEDAHARRGAPEQRRAVRGVYVGGHVLSGKSLNQFPTSNSQLPRFYSPSTLTLIVSQSPVIVACLSSPACTTSLCMPGDNCMSIVFLPSPKCTHGLAFGITEPTGKQSVSTPRW